MDSVIFDFCKEHPDCTVKVCYDPELEAMQLRIFVGKYFAGRSLDCRYHGILILPWREQTKFALKDMYDEIKGVNTDGHGVEGSTV